MFVGKGLRSSVEKRPHDLELRIFDREYCIHVPRHQKARQDCAHFALDVGVVKNSTIRDLVSVRSGEAKALQDVILDSFFSNIG